MNQKYYAPGDVIRIEHPVILRATDLLFAAYFCDAIACYSSAGNFHFAPSVQPAACAIKTQLGDYRGPLEVCAVARRRYSLPVAPNMEDPSYPKAVVARPIFDDFTIAWRHGLVTGMNDRAITDIAPVEAAEQLVKFCQMIRKIDKQLNAATPTYVDYVDIGFIAAPDRESSAVHIYRNAEENLAAIIACEATYEEEARQLIQQEVTA